MENRFRCSNCKKESVDKLYSKKKKFDDKERWMCIDCYTEKHGAWVIEKESYESETQAGA